MSSDCCSNTERLHFLLVPLMEQGHMIPMVDLVRLLAIHNTLVTFVTTPINLARIQPIVDRAMASALPICFVELPFPVDGVGLSDGCENIDLLPSNELIVTFLNALSLLRDPLEAHLRMPDLFGWPKPACLISDNLHHWTADLVRSLNIPRLIFHGPSCFFLLCNHLINQNRVELEAELVAASGGSIMLPGLPHAFQINRHEVITLLSSNPDSSKYMETIRAAEESSTGVLVNSFIELEPLYFERYREAINKPVWPVGPLSLYKEELEAKEARSRVSSIDNKLIFEWLDKQEVESVLLISFGSMIRNTMAQLVELGHGLEASGRPFIWAVKEVAERQLSGVEEWMVEFEKTVEGRGLVIRGWAPHAVILGHVAVGGFMTHCGWSSTLEAIVMRVTMATWPHFYDQFLNERLVVEVLKIGVSVGIKEPIMLGVKNGDEVAVNVSKGEVERVVERLMGGGKEGEERRGRAWELREKVKKAMKEGGSPWKGLQDVINYVL